jgi:tRNA G18 (ribose-2'-O)-methylase SpoU
MAPVRNPRSETAAVAMTPVPIEDPADPRLADYFELADPTARRRRERDQLFVVEGITAIERLLESEHRIRSVLVTPRAHARLAGRLAGLAAPVFVASREILAATVGFDLHRGAVAAADRRPLRDVADVLTGAHRVAVLEGLNDAENLGAIARSARALGVEAMVLDPTCIDPYYRRIVRVSMGEVLLLPIARAGAWPGELHAVRDAGFTLWALTPDPTADDLWSLGVPERVAVLLGAEGPGLTNAALRAADRRVRIPINPTVDSLNVGHAAAIAFAALSRPRIT